MLRQINEVTRSTLVSKGKKGAHYRHQPNTNRWQAKSNCKVANTVKDYNKLDMDTLWKKDELTFNVRVEGESDNYFVTVTFSNVLQKIQDNIKRNKNKLDAKIVYQALLQILNSSDVKIDCTCKDFKYRFRVWATKQGYNAGQSETRPAKITNPNDNLGSGCKHVLAVLNNADWLNKISSVIVNYANYCKDNMEYNYSRFIFPKLYGMTYNKAVQLTINDLDKDGEVSNTLASDEELINLSNALGKIRGRIKKGSNKNPVAANAKTDDD